MKRKFGLITGAVLLLALIFSAFVFFTKKKETSPVYGTYRISSNDPMIQRSVQNQDIYFQLKDDHLIIYNTTINGKPKFNLKGAYTVDTKTNTLNIKWFGGHLPKHLKVENEGEDYIIRIGETTYKKEKEKS